MHTPAHPRLLRLLQIGALLCGGLCGGMALAVGGPMPITDAEPTRLDVILLLGYVLLALVFSFLCSVAEATLLSITPAYIARLRETHPLRASLLKRLKQDQVDRSLAAILTLNTIAHTVGAIGSGSKATVVFGNAWFGLFSAVMTLLILFASEIVPKTLGAVYWRQLAMPAAHFVRGLIWILYPLIVVSEQLTRLIAGGRKVHGFSRDEFVAMAGVGEESGQIAQQESRILRNLFRLQSLRAEDVMTPRVVIVGFAQNQSVAEVLDDPRVGPFSRLPIYAKDIDEAAAFVLKTDLLQARSAGQGEQAVADFARRLPTVPDTMPLGLLLDFLLDKSHHIALVVDEYGGTAGLVSLEDVVETLLGSEIVDEQDTESNMRSLARRQWRKRADRMGIGPTLD
ncbi:MAG: CNNM domain-containing protein [Oceanococcaceae bacterium]